jgi:hypothetical protein
MVMSHRLRIWIASLLCLALVGQTTAFVRLGLCHGAAVSGMVAMSNDIAASARSHDHASHEHEHHGARQDRASNSDEDGMKCPVCASCCHFSALAGSTIGAAPNFEPAASAFSFLFVPRIRNVADGLERPPRS